MINEEDDQLLNDLIRLRHSYVKDTSTVRVSNKLISWLIDKLISAEIINVMLESRLKMEREYTKVIRRLATASYNVRNSADEDPMDIDLHADNDWARAEAIYKELIKIEEERYG